jgi:N-acyl homoserine lactone hydrolase
LAAASGISGPRNWEDTEATIRSVQVLRSGSGEQHREHRYGSGKPLLWWVLTSRSWIKLPINYFLIEHKDGPVLFDTGLDPSIVSNPQYIKNPVGRFLLKRIFRLHISEKDRMKTVLATIGQAPENIRTAVISHLHFDHVGGIADIPQADLLVSQQEWAQLSEPHPERKWILKEHINIPHARWRPITFQPSADPLFIEFEGIYDVAGDGSMILLPTPGHTPGSLSMLIRCQGWAPILLIGDLTYEASLLQNDTAPGVGDASVLRKSFAKVRQLKTCLPDLVIVPSHDYASVNDIDRATRGPFSAATPNG